MLKKQIEKMVRAMHWADEQLIAALGSCPAAQAEAVPLLGHVLAAEKAWLARLERRATDQPVWPKPTLAECEALATENLPAYSAYLARLDDAGLAEVLDYKTSTGLEMSNSVVDILTHVVIHGSYHRGQIAKMLGRAGASAPNTDYIMYLRVLKDGA